MKRDHVSLTKPFEDFSTFWNVQKPERKFQKKKNWVVIFSLVLLPVFSVVSSSPSEVCNFWNLTKWKLMTDSLKGSIEYKKNAFRATNCLCEKKKKLCLRRERWGPPLDRGPCLDVLIYFCRQVFAVPVSIWYIFVNHISWPRGTCAGFQLYFALWNCFWKIGGGVREPRKEGWRGKGKMVRVRKKRRFAFLNKLIQAKALTGQLLTRSGNEPKI